MVKLCPPQIAATTFAFSSVFILLLHMLWLQEIRMSDRLVIDHPPPPTTGQIRKCAVPHPPTHITFNSQLLPAHEVGGEESLVFIMQVVVVFLWLLGNSQTGLSPPSMSLKTHISDSFHAIYSED